MELTDRETQTLKQIARDRMPRVVTNPEHITNDGLGRNESADYAAAHVNQHIRRALARPRVDADVNADEEVKALLKKKGVDLAPGEVYSIGVSRNQIFDLDKKELRALIEMKRNQAVEEGVGLRPSPAISKPSLPRRIFDAVKQTWVEVGA